MTGSVLSKTAGAWAIRGLSTHVWILKALTPTPLPQPGEGLPGAA
jgi:hypothetical protein